MFLIICSSDDRYDDDHDDHQEENWIRSVHWQLPQELILARPLPPSRPTNTCFPQHNTSVHTKQNISNVLVEKEKMKWERRNLGFIKDFHWVCWWWQWFQRTIPTTLIFCLARFAGDQLKVRGKYLLLPRPQLPGSELMSSVEFWHLGMM